MAIFPSIDSDERATFQSNILSCPSKEQWISFQLVDENGNGAPYAGLCYKLMDRVIPPFLKLTRSRPQATRANFCFGVMPPRAIFGRS